MFERLQRKPPAEGEIWQRKRDKSKRVQIVSYSKNDKDVPSIVVRDENGARERPLSLKTFVEEYEPGDEILAKYEDVCGVRQVAPARPRRGAKPKLGRLAQLQQRLGR